MGYCASFSGRFSLRTVLIVPFAIQMVALIGLVGYLSIRSGQQVVNDIASQLCQEISDRTSERIRTYFKTLHQIHLSNELVSNALKDAFPQGQAGQIKISLRACNNEEFILVISDNGVGIPPNLDFRNTDSLGLQLVCGTTRQIGGTIELDPSQGTTFTIKFKEVKYKPSS